VSFSVLFVCICVLYYCHRVATQLQLTNLSWDGNNILNFSQFSGSSSSVTVNSF
jgi:hypothetical protein